MCTTQCTCMCLLLQVPDEEKGEHREPSDVEEGEGEGEEEEEEEDDESDDEETPLIKFQKKPNQFVKALLAFWPFGEAFKELSIFNKIIEIIKVNCVLYNSRYLCCHSRLLLHVVFFTLDEKLVIYPPKPMFTLPLSSHFFP